MLLIMLFICVGIVVLTAVIAAIYFIMRERGQ